MQYSDDFQDEGTATQFEPTPWGSRQRVMPRRGFKAAVSVIAPLPGLPPAPRMPASTPVLPVPVLNADPSWFVSHAPLRLESSSFITPIVREADLQTWKVPKLPAPANARFDIRRLDLRLWLPIASLVAVLVLAFFGTRSTTTHMSAALGPDVHPITMATIEAPPVMAAPIIAAVPAPVIAIESAPVAAPVVAIERTPVAKRVALAAPVMKQSARSYTRISSSKRPHLDMNVATPLGDLAKHHR